MTDYTPLSDGELEQLARDELRRKIRLEAQADACGATVNRLLAEIAERAICRKSIKRGDLVTVRYRDGCKDYVFEGIAGWWSGEPRIRLRAFTAKGRPFKRTEMHKITLIIPFLDRKDQRNG
jgi:hypothetical protein